MKTPEGGYTFPYERAEMETFYGFSIPSHSYEKAEKEAFMRAFYGPPTTPTCETDKPEGTRNVDKFLKEQQNALWNS